MTGIDNQLKIRARVDVSGIRRSIEDALKRDAEIEADNIIVDVSGSQVTLRGNVQTLRERAVPWCNRRQGSPERRLNENEHLLGIR